MIFQVIRDLVQGGEKLKATTIWAEPDYRAEVAALAIAKAAKNTQRVVEQSLSCLWPPGLAKSAVANLGQAAVLDLVALKADDPGEPAAAPVFDPWAAAAAARPDPKRSTAPMVVSAWAGYSAQPSPKTKSENSDASPSEETEETKDSQRSVPKPPWMSERR